MEDRDGDLLTVELTRRMAAYTDQARVAIEEDPEIFKPALNLFVCMLLTTELLSQGQMPQPLRELGRVMVLRSFLGSVGIDPAMFAMTMDLSQLLLNASAASWIAWLLATPIPKFKQLYIQAAEYAALVAAQLNQIQEDADEA